MKLVKIVLISTLFFLACSQIHFKQSAEPFVSMQRTACYGTCPQYTVSIYNNGIVHYEGKLFVEKIGCFSSKIPFRKVKSLKLFLEEMDFFSLESVYPAPMTDIPSVITKVVITNKEHEVIDQFQGPKELQQLHYLVDSIIDSVDSWSNCETK